MKKKITLLLFLLGIPILSFSQKLVDTLYTFRVVDNSQIVWQKVFSSDIDDLQNSFKKEVVTNLQLENLQELGNTISFTVKNENIDFKKYGGTWGGTAAFIKYPHNFLVVIDFKENRYRVTIKLIKIDFSSEDLGIIDLETFLLKKGKLKNNKLSKVSLSYYHKHFSDKFTLKQINDDW